jgi:hypothetical protein
MNEPHDVPSRDDAVTLREFRDWTFKVHQRADGKADSIVASLACAALGISGELSELFDDDADDLLEAGDTCSYVFLAAALLELDPATWMPENYMDQPELCAENYHGSKSTIYAREDLIVDALKQAARFSELVKKEVFQGKQMSRPRAAELLASIFQRVSAWCGANGYSVRQVLLANTIKLESRYPLAEGA